MNGPLIQIKDNEICYLEYDGRNNLCFFDLLERKNITTIKIIGLTTICDSLVMMTKDLLLVTGENKLSIININTHKIIKTIDASGSNWIKCTCLLSENMLLTGDDKKE